ncbi:hypothetical protein JXB11_01255 [Candidatus Woesearchaeota archaeon]|nr:hypothetical protein [Candidatus Woesearchaeota archaeon]
MGIEKVKDDVLEKANKEAEKLIGEGKAEARRIMKEAEKALDKKKEQEASSIEKMKEGMKTRMVSAAELEAKKGMLNARKKALDKVLEKVKAKVKSLPESKRLSHIEKLLERAKKELEIAKVYCAEQDARLVSGYNVKKAEMLGGLMAENSEGNVIVDFSYDSLLEELYRDMMKEISESLFKK